MKVEVGVSMNDSLRSVVVSFSSQFYLRKDREVRWEKAAKFNSGILIGKVLLSRVCVQVAKVLVFVFLLSLSLTPPKLFSLHTQQAGEMSSALHASHVCGQL